jgi:hypothetical protein
MPRKVVILLLAAAVTANSGCQTKRADEPQPVAAKVAAAPTPTPRSTPAPRKPPTPAPAADDKPAPAPPQQTTNRNDDLASLIKGETRWADNRRDALIVTDQRGATAGEPVPLFRQAIVIASVRSAVAGSAAAPEASFRNGQLTLAFRRGTPSEVAAAVNRALAVPEVGRLVVVPPAN